MNFRQELYDKTKEWALNADLVNVTIGEDLVTKNSKRFSELGLFVNPFSNAIGNKVIELFLDKKDSDAIGNKWDELKSDCKYIVLLLRFIFLFTCFVIFLYNYNRLSNMNTIYSILSFAIIKEKMREI